MGKVVLASEVDLGNLPGQILGRSAKNFGVIAVIVLGQNAFLLEIVNNTYDAYFTDCRKNANV